jgi:DNA polymerase lambda
MYMGVCKAPKDTHFRRIDIKVYPKGQYGFALLYFTGSDVHNRTMRAHAETMGLTLSDHGLVQISNPKKGHHCEKEEDVFKVLKLPYKTPRERDI